MNKTAVIHIYQSINSPDSGPES